mgnify:FL=1
MKKKLAVYDFWNRFPFGEELILRSTDQKGYDNQARSRYELEGDMIFPLAYLHWLKNFGQDGLFVSSCQFRGLLC